MMMMLFQIRNGCIGISPRVALEVSGLLFFTLFFFDVQKKNLIGVVV